METGNAIHCRTCVRGLAKATKSLRLASKSEGVFLIREATRISPYTGIA